MAVPIRIGEHDIRSTIRAMLVGGLEETSQMRPNAQYVEVVPAHFIDKDAGWIFAGVQPGLSDIKRCQTIEAAVAIA